MALFCSWYLPVNHGAWSPVDSAIFHFFNHGVSVSHAYAWLLAIINNRAFDACSLLAMGCLMLRYWLKAPPAGRRQIAIMGLVMLLAAVIINQLAQHLMPVQRASPSLFSTMSPASAMSSISPPKTPPRTASLAIMG